MEKIKKENNVEKLKDIKFVRYSPENSNPEITNKLIDCYRKVFAEDPWNEWRKCSCCGNSWGVKDKDQVKKMNNKCCGKNLVDFWPKEQVASDISKEITRESSCWLSMRKDRVIGFCWGYPIKIDDLEKKIKLKLSKEFRDKLKFSQIGYQDEIGVISKFRDKKVAKKMAKKRLNDFLRNKNISMVACRVKGGCNPSKTFLWYTKKLGYEIIGKYQEGDDRVVVGRPIKGLKKLLNSNYE